jgi:nitrate reductase gamma subunit
MNKQLILKNLFLGFLSWLIPFLFSFLFFKPNGEKIIPHDLFKAIMVVVGSISGSYLIIQYFKSIQEDFFKHGVVIGITW